MTLIDELERLLLAQQHARTKPDDLRDARDLYEEFERDGLLRSTVYDLPQIDTIGRMAVRRAGSS